jgi:uncharacterized membrane protein
VPYYLSVNTTRLEAFSDGVFAIAATLLVLDLHVPEDAADGLGAALAAQWPAYAAYLVSFLTIGIIWVNHHALIAHARRADRTLLFLNLFLLLTASVIPFPTSLLGDYVTAAEGSHVAAAVYGGVMVANAVAFTALWRHVTHTARLLGGHMTPQRARQESRLFSIGLVAYAAGIALSFLSATAALVLYGLVAVFYVFPWLPEVERPAAPAQPAAG